MTNSKIYSIYSKYYDLVEGRPERSINFVQSILGKYLPNGQSILELGCGTGNVIGALDANLNLTGLDISDEMIQIAKKKFLHIDFVQGDMTNFNLDQKFDLIFSVYDSINHVLEKKGWESVFSSVDKHLKEGGYFVFDINTLGKLKTLTETTPHNINFEQNLLIMDVVEQENSIFDWNIDVFERQDDNNFKKFSETIKETSFPQDKIVQMLEEYFNVISITNQDFEPVDNETGRIFFVCEKK